MPFPLSVAQNIEALQQAVLQLAHTYHRDPDTLHILAVTKTQSVSLVKEAIAAGLKDFGENYIKEALPKIASLAEYPLTWHFIGPIQSNKTQDIARHFSWVHSVDREKIARRLNDQRPPTLEPLNVCLEVNVGEETSKSGVPLHQVEALAQVIATLPHLKLRGLMCIPPPSDDVGRQRHYFKQLRLSFEALCRLGYPLDTLSMGMSQDYPAAIAEGSTIIRIGSALFGKRDA